MDLSEEGKLAREELLKMIEEAKKAGKYTSETKKNIIEIINRKIKNGYYRGEGKDKVSESNLSTKTTNDEIKITGWDAAKEISWFLGKLTLKASFAILFFSLKTSWWLLSEILFGPSYGKSTSKKADDCLLNMKKSLEQIDNPNLKEELGGFLGCITEKKDAKACNINSLSKEAKELLRELFSKCEIDK